MKNTSLEPLFLPPASNIDSLLELTAGDFNRAELRHALNSLDFNTAYDFLRTATRRMVLDIGTDTAIAQITDFDVIVQRMGTEHGHLLDIHAALIQILTAVHIYAGNIDDALRTAADTLNLLSLEARRKDEPFLLTLATLLYDLALVHNERGEYKQAEREIEKSLRIFEKLAKINPDRYGAAHMMSVNAATQIYRSRERQTAALANAHEATAMYLTDMAEGVEGAGMRLIDSLTQEGRTLAKMGRQREAIQYFTRALKYLGKIEPEFSIQQLELSIDLGEALLAVKTTRDKGVHLLNTMLHKATKLNADALHRRIVDVLYNAKHGGTDILGFWHKIFPR
jgi:hypothetical protein